MKIWAPYFRGLATGIILGSVCGQRYEIAFVMCVSAFGISLLVSHYGEELK